MQTLVMVPALCCDEGLYEEVGASLSDLVSIRIINPYEASFVACAKKVLDEVEDDFIIMGTSFGGHVARETALAAPDRVKGLWIIGAGPGAVADPKSGYERGAKLRDGQAEDVYQQFFKIITHLPGERGSEAADMFLKMAWRGDPVKTALQADALASRLDRWNDLKRISCPTLLLWGMINSLPLRTPCAWRASSRMPVMSRSPIAAIFRHWKLPKRSSTPRAIGSRIFPERFLVAKPASNFGGKRSDIGI